MAVVVRAFAADDCGPLVRAIDAVCGEGQWMATPRFQPTPAWDHALGAADCPHHLLLIARDEEQVAGWCRVFPAQCGEPAGAGELGIGVQAAYRGRGLGQRLAGEALAWAARRGVTRVTLSVRAANVRAVALFVECGFVPAGCAVEGWLEMECRPRPAGG